MLRWLIGALILSVGITFAIAEYGRTVLAPASLQPAPQLFEVAQGSSFGSVARRLEKQGLIQNAQAATWMARYNEIDGKLHVGEYEISPHQSTREILEIITQGRVKTWRVTLPEGSRASEIGETLEAHGLVKAEDFQKALQNAQLAESLDVPFSNFEGYLYPDTYSLSRGLPAEEVIRILVDQFHAVWKNEIQPQSKSLGLSQHEIVTLASIVEKETAAPEERARIAAVFLNRLKLGMRLETDPTVIYGVADFDGNLRRKHLKDKTNPYNTYQHLGLPPGPIASPGHAALEAVIEPEETEYLYFVSKNDGTHKFSRTYAEHKKAVDRYQRRRR